MGKLARTWLMCCISSITDARMSCSVSNHEGLRVFRATSSVSFAAQSGQSARRMCREEEAFFGRADHWGVAAGGLPSEARELKQLRDENTKLKRLVADLSLDKVMLQDVVQKKF
jgi:putative transposase